MWEKSGSVLVNDYKTIVNKNFDLHFYVRGSEADRVSDALVENLNNSKRSNVLKIRDLIGEIAFMENGTCIGCAGVPKKIKSDDQDIFDNAERREFLKNTIKNF